MFYDLINDIAGENKEAITDYRYKCPFCGETKFKFYVQKESPYLWQCYHCGRSGRPVTFVMQYYGVTFHKAVDILDTYMEDEGLLNFEQITGYDSNELTEAEQILLSLTAHNNTPTSTEAMTAVLYPTNTKFFQFNMHNPEAYPYMQYLVDRGVTLKQLLQHGMGYVIRGEVAKTDGEGTITITNSVIFTTFDDHNQPRYWNTRSIEPDAYIKALNAPARRDQFGKNNSIFNLNRARKTDKIIISEGVFNALTTGDSGVATFGKQVTEGQVSMLAEAGIDNPKMKYYIFLDTDATKEALKLAKKLYQYVPNVYLVENPYKGKDANDLGSAITQELIRKAIPYTEENSLKFILGI